MDDDLAALFDKPPVDQPDDYVITSGEMHFVREFIEKSFWHLGHTIIWKGNEIQNNVIMQSFQHKVKKFYFLGSSCIYPCHALQPIKEEYLLTGSLEPTNEGYTLAKISGYKLCLYLSDQYGWDTISLMPCSGWKTEITLDEGIKRTVREYQQGDFDVEKASKALRVN